MKVFAPKPKQIPFTKTGYQHLLDEKKKLLEERPEAVENLRKSREMGDLSENGYYKASRARLTTLDARLRHLDRLIRFGKVVESAHTGCVDIGSVVTISDGKKEMTYTIVGGYESDPKQNTISYFSPIGKALMGKKEKETVEVTIPSGIVVYLISSIN